MTTDLKELSALIAVEVRSELVRQGLTQQELADRLGVRQWWISRRVGAVQRADISAAEVVLIADALNIEPQALLSSASEAMAARREQVA